MTGKTIINFLVRIFLLLGLVNLCPLAFAVQIGQEASVSTMKWSVADQVREAIVYIPNTAKTKSTPIIFIFHGHGGTMGNMFRARGFEKLWPEAIIICPQGLNTPGQLTDPEGKKSRWQKALGDMGDRDLHFFDAILKTMQNTYKIDHKRIYGTGHSNGGGFSYLLWASRGDIFAAFATSAAVGGRVTNQLKPKPTMHIMGEQDELVKTAWQKAMCLKLLALNDCKDTGDYYGQFATLYPSATKNPTILYVHPGGHSYPKAANETVIKFFKSISK